MCLFGPNECGKSNLLKAVELFDEDKANYPDDFFDDSKEINIWFEYQIENQDIANINSFLHEHHNFPKDILSRHKPSEVVVYSSFEANSTNTVSRKESISFIGGEVLKGFVDIEGKLVKRIKEHESLPNVKLSEFFSQRLPEFFYPETHKTTFWTSSPQFLMLDEIDLVAFSQKPRESSIPLFNSFKLAGYKTVRDIRETIKQLDKASRIHDLESRLSDAVTNHIRKIWPNHAVNIIYEIHNNRISLLVEDEGVRHKTKTTSQRSDGFKQFISFLLTISAQNSSAELTNNIVIIDEPETHLHPQAQLNLLKELISLAKPINRNIVLYATHSPFMIDKKNLHRNIRIYKESNEKTALSVSRKGEGSFSEIIFTVFDIPTTDYHNQLFGYCEKYHQNKLNALKKDRSWYNDKLKRKEQVSICTYIRHSIHHPENSKNKPYTNAQLNKSIELMRKIKYGKN